MMRRVLVRPAPRWVVLLFALAGCHGFAGMTEFQPDPGILEHVPREEALERFTERYSDVVAATGGGYSDDPLKLLSRSVDHYGFSYLAKAKRGKQQNSIQFREIHRTLIKTYKSGLFGAGQRHYIVALLDARGSRIDLLYTDDKEAAIALSESLWVLGKWDRK